MQNINRKNAILKLLTAEKIGSQEKLVEFLKNEGFAVKQSSVSRDLEKLGIEKINGFYTFPAKNDSNIFGLLKLETAGDCLIVAKCSAGLASAIAVRIDAANISEIVGTIAGDDTVFIAVKNESFQTTAVQKIREVFEK